MERDHESSDSSSWSLVDVNDASSDDGTDASDIDSVGDDLIVESVHDSDSEYESEEDDDDEVVSVAEEATEESDLDEPLEPEIEDDEEEGIEGEIKNEDSESEPEQGEEDDDDENVDEGVVEESEAVEIVEEEEALAEAAALHFVEPAKVAAKFEELSKTMDTPFDQFFESIATPESGTRSLIFAIVMLITVMAVGFGHYIGACLIGNQAATVSSLGHGGPFCYESDRITTSASLPPFMIQQPGLQYRDDVSFVSAIKDAEEEESSTTPPSSPPSTTPLQQCKENLYDAQAEVKMKSGVNRFVRENYKRQLQKAKQDFEARLESYKRASRRLLASKYSSFSSEQQKQQKPDFQKVEKEDSICKSIERPFLNLTRSIFSSVSNWSSNNSVVKNFIKFSPAFDESLAKVSSWLRRSNNLSNNVYQHFHSLTTVPKLSKALNEVPKKAWNFLRSDFRKYAKKVTTALSKANLQTKIMEYKQLPIIQKFKNRVESALSRLSELKTHAEVCFAAKKLRPCEGAVKLAKNIENGIPEFSGLIGKRQSKEYLQYLNSLSENNCSLQMACEKDWWTGCGPQFLQNCQLRKWQVKRVFSGAALINRNRKMKDAAIEMGWVLPKDRRNPIRCCHLSNSPLPCPSSNILPDLPQDSLAPCHIGILPSSANPCHQNPKPSSSTPATPPRPCPASNQPCKPFHKPAGNGRPDWFSQRAATRASQRQAHSHKLFSSASKSNNLHFKNRRKQHA